MPNFTKHAIFYILAVMLVAVMPSCTDRAAKALAQADSVIEEHPDSGYAILLAVAEQPPTTDAGKALHGLLLTEACVKLDLPLPSDSIIDASASFFERSADDPFNIMRSRFYQGYVAYALGLVPKAVRSAQGAFDLANEAGDDYWGAKSAELMADLYSQALMHKQAMALRLESARRYQQAGRERNSRFALCDAAFSQHNCSIPGAIARIDSILDVARDSDPTLSAYAHRYLGHIYATKAQCEKSLEQYDSISAIGYSYCMLPHDWINYAYDLSVLGHPQAAQAMDYADSIATTDQLKASLFTYKARLMQKKHNLEGALHAVDSALNNLYADLSQILENEIGMAQSDYYKSQMQQERHSVSIFKTLALVLTLVLVIIVLVSFGLVYLKNSRIASQVAEITSLNTQIQDKQIEIASVSSKRLRALYVMCDEYFNSTSNSKKAGEITKEIKQIVEEFREEFNISLVINAVDKSCDGLASRFIEESKGILSTQQQQLAVMLFSNMKPKTICVILDMNAKTLYTTRARMKKKIEESDMPDCEIYIQKLG